VRLHARSKMLYADVEDNRRERSCDEAVRQEAVVTFMPTTCGSPKAATWRSPGPTPDMRSLPSARARLRVVTFADAHCLVPAPAGAAGLSVRDIPGAEGVSGYCAR
jgi:hypothetical protein